MKKDVYVLGTGLSHNGFAVILKNGKVAIGIEKERIDRIKHDGGNDSLAVQYCLDALNITLADIDLVVQCENFCTPPQDQFSGKRLFED
jgi:carbamoyltransferase